MWYHNYTEIREVTIMIIIDITKNIQKVQAKNPMRKFSDIAEWALADYYNIERHMHDSKSDSEGADVEVENENLYISVKTARWTLVSGKKGFDTMDTIWENYENTTRSNMHAYIAKNGIAYMMNINEWKNFVYKFAGLERDSKKNGGNWKIRGRRESQKMLDYLALMA